MWNTLAECFYLIIFVCGSSHRPFSFLVFKTWACSLGGSIWQITMSFFIVSGKWFNLRTLAENSFRHFLTHFLQWAGLHCSLKRSGIDWLLFFTFGRKYWDLLVQNTVRSTLLMKYWGYPLSVSLVENSWSSLLKSEMFEQSRAYLMASPFIKAFFISTGWYEFQGR